MRDGFKVIDADRHVLEPSDLFANYLPAKFRDRVRIEGPNQFFRSVDGEPTSDADKLRSIKNQEDYGFTFAGSKSWRETFADALAAKFDAASNVRDMEREGVDVSVLFPTLGLYIMWRSNLDPELSAAICRAYNTWLADYCSYDQKRLYGVALIPLQDPQRAVVELKHAKEKLGLVGIFWRPNKLCGRTLASPDYFQFMRSLRIRGCRSASTRGLAPCSNKPARIATANSAGTLPATRWNKCSPVSAFVLTACWRNSPN
jgi:hypothetical protein